MITEKSTLRALIMGALLITANHAMASGYTFTDLGQKLIDASITSTQSQIEPTAINQIGEVVGTYKDISSHTQAVLWSNQTAVKLTTTANYDSYATGINDTGQISGIIAPQQRPYSRAVTWNNNTLTELAPAPYLSSAYSEVYAINNAGQFAGANQDGPVLWSGSTKVLLEAGGWSYAINNAGQVVGVGADSAATLWTNGKSIKLGFGLSSEAVDINDAGQIVGDDYYSEGKLWDNGSVISLGGGNLPHAINNLGQIVGSTNGGLYRHAAILSTSGAIDLNTLLDPEVANAGWVLLDATDINDQGQIIGRASNAISGRMSAFLLSPTAAVPESSTFFLMMLGLGAGSLMTRRRQDARTKH
jgi:uncharacterized membrane protein